MNAVLVEKVGSKRILASAAYEQQDLGMLNIVLVEKVPGKEWVVARMRPGENEWFWGHYFDNITEAYKDFGQRVADSAPRNPKHIAPLVVDSTFTCPDCAKPLEFNPQDESWSCINLVCDAE